MTEQLSNTSPQPQQNFFNAQKLISRAIDYWYLYVLSLSICIGFAWFKIHYATPMYKVYGQVIVLDDKSSGGSAQALSGNGVDFSSLFSSRVNMDNELTIFQSSDICKKVVDKLQLYISYYHRGSVRAVELYTGSPFQLVYHPDNDIILPKNLEVKFPTSIGNDFLLTTDGKSIRWHFFDTLHLNKASYYFIKKGIFDTTAAYQVQIQSPDAVAGAIAANLSAGVLSPKSTIINLSYNTNLPEKGQDVLGGVMQAYVNRNLNQKNTTADSTIQFINSRIALIGNDLGNIETTIQRFKENNKIADLTAQSSQLITTSLGYYQRLSDIEVQLQVIQTMLSYVQNEQNNRRPVPSLLSSDGTFTGLVGAYNAAQVQRDKILLSLKEDNPIAANLDVQIAGLRSDIIKSLKSQQQALTISRQNLVSENNLVSNQIRDVPEQERKSLDYAREQNVKEALYLFLLQRREEIAIAKASNSSNASIVTAPRASYVPYEPTTSTYYTIGILIGLVLPTAFILLKFSLNNKVLGRDDVTDITPATILSEVGHSSKQGLLNLTDEGRSIIAEQFRIFRTNMDFALANNKNPVIMITSCLSGEGKSFVAANLGQIYAIGGKKVLLVELDLRRPKLSKMLDIPRDTGFSNYIISDKPISHFIQPVAGSPSLFLLPAGPIPPNPAELLMSDKVSILLEELKQQFDIIIIDTAPIGAVTDAQIIGKHANISLYVVRQNYSIKSSIEIVNDMMLSGKLKNMYLILNDVREGVSYKYGYGYRYGYGYGYSEAIEPAKEKKWWNRNGSLKS